MTMEIQEKMNSMRLRGMATSWESLVENRQHLDLDLEEGLGILLQAEEEDRQYRRLERLKKAAGFLYQAAIEELNFDKKRGMDKQKILKLSDCHFIKKGESVLITGPTGAGKSHLASALGHQACSMGYKTYYFNMQKFLSQLKVSRADGSILKLHKKIGKQHLLILDDFGLQPLNERERLDLLDIIEDRHGRKSTIISSQLPVNKWYDIIGENTVADAIMDRISHHSHRIELKGESLRKNM